MMNYIPGYKVRKRKRGSNDEWRSACSGALFLTEADAIAQIRGIKSQEYEYKIVEY